jgi:DNA-binding MarR family transcriptional regulator
MKTDYYYTKDSADDWTVHGRRHHLQVVRTEGSSGREDRRGREIYQTLFLVKDRSSVIDLSDQFESDEHGFTRLKDALQYAVDKLGEYDGRVDQRKTKKNPDPPLSLYPGEIAILRILSYMNGATAYDVQSNSSGLYLTTKQIASRIQRLFRRGWVDRSIGLVDGRETYLYEATDEGRAALKRNT